MTESSSKAEETKLPTRAKLWWPAALLLSFVNWSVDFYPRLTSGRRMRSVKTEAIIAQHVEATTDWARLKATREELDDAIALAKASLDEVKAQTEYQDQKATRLLTVTTFLSALSAGLYAAFNGAHPMAAIWSDGPVAGWLQVGAHLAFLAFVVAVLGGMLITFHATRTRFKYPSEATAKKESGSTRSFLFFREVIGVTPTGWAQSFVAAAADGADVTLRTDLKVDYLKNYVGEAYLIAAKTADKLRYLEPAQSLLAWALRCLLIFVVLIAVITAKWPAAGSKPTQIEGTAGKPLSVKVVR